MGRKIRSCSTGLILAVCCCAGTGCQSFLANGQIADGRREYQQGNFQAAIQRFSQATYTNAQNPNGYYNLGVAYHQLGRKENRAEYLTQAESYYHQCLDRDKDHVECHRALAVLLTQQNRSPEAFRLMEGWVTTSPTAAEARVELARLYEDFGDSQTAKTHLQEAVARDPRNSRALAALGRIHEKSGNVTQALADYQRALEYNRFQPELQQRVIALQSGLNRTSATLPAATPIPAAAPSRIVTQPYHPLPYR